MSLFDKEVIEINNLTVVNFFGGPGSGKSTGAAYVFSKLKMMGVNCEIVTEYAKDKTWEKTTKVFENQLYIFGKQYFKIYRLQGEVDLAITDSPLPFSIVYNKNPHLGESFERLVFDVFNTYNNINFFINRTKHYSEVGRWETLDEAIKVDNKIIKTLENNNIDYCSIFGDEDGYDQAIEIILGRNDLYDIKDIRSHERPR